MKKYFTYILLCDQKTFYVGSTDNVERRLVEHRSGKSFFTKKFSDIQLAYKEELESRQKSEARERQLKGWSIAKKRALISGNFDELIKLSKSTEHGEVLPPNL